MSFLTELKRRKVFQAAAVYAVVAWLLIQIADVLLPTFGAPDWVMPVFSTFVILGFPLVIILSWAYDITPDGVQSSADVDASDHQKPAAASTINQILLTLVTLAVVFLAVDRFLLNDSSTRLASAPLTSKPAQLLLKLPPDTYLAVDTDHPALALSPDGSTLVAVAYRDGVRHLFVRELDKNEFRRIDGTQNAASPFFSPDGKWIAFFSVHQLKKVAVDGGAAIPIRPAIGTDVNRGATWSRDGEIIIAGSVNGGLEAFSADPDVTGSRNLTDPLAPYAWPSNLPDSSDFLFTDRSGSDQSGPSIGKLSGANKSIHTLISNGTFARYSLTGHILYARMGQLYALAFDGSKILESGAETRLVANLVTAENGAAQFAVSADGTLAYISGKQRYSDRQLVLVDRSGNTEILLDHPNAISNPRFSPDGSQLAMTMVTNSNLDVWVLDVRRGSLARWTTDPGEDFGPVWGPDGLIAYSSEYDDDGLDGPGLAWQKGSGGMPERLSTSPKSGNWEFPATWSPDGRYLVYQRTRNRTQNDAILFDAKTHQSSNYLDTPFSENGLRISPNGKWLAYSADDTGRAEVYLRSFPVAGDAIQISVGGGDEPVWASDGQQIFYRDAIRMMAVKLNPDPTENPGQPQTLFEGIYDTIVIGADKANYDVSPVDGRFVMIRRKNTELPTEIHVVLNWPEALDVN